MKNLKRTVVGRAMCMLLTAAMLCADTGVTVYAAEGAEQKVLEETVEETSTGEVQTENGQTEESSTEKDTFEGNEQTEGDLAEKEEKEQPSTEEMPAEGGAVDKKSGEENTEIGASEDESVAEDGMVVEAPVVEEEDNTGSVLIEEFVSENDIEESVSENAIEKDAEENLLEVTKDSGDNIIASGEYTENGSNTTWSIDSDGKLTVEGTGEFGDDTGYYGTRAPWYNYRESIKSVEVNVTGMTNASCMFYQCENLVEVDLSNFDTSKVTDMSGMFEACFSLKSLDLSNFDTGNVINMKEMFGDCHSLNSLDINSFDTSNVWNMGSMFVNCWVLVNLDLSSFNTCNVIDMSSMFAACFALTSLDLHTFDTSSVTSMSSMFSACSALTSLDLHTFDTSSVTSMGVMFGSCEELSSLDLSHFNTSNVTNMSGMFLGCNRLTSLDLSNFNTSNVTDMNGMFSSCKKLTSLDLSNFDTSNVKDMQYMFQLCESLINVNVGSFDTHNVTNMCGMFVGCEKLTSLDLSHFNTSNVTSMSGMFLDCFSLEDLNLSGFDTGRVMSMEAMFRSCHSLTRLDVSCFDTRNVTDMQDMFLGCIALTGLDVSGFDTSKVTDMNGMFQECIALTNLDVSSFDTGKVSDISHMFFWCSSLESLDLSGFDVSKLLNADYFLSSCQGLTEIRTPFNLILTIPLSAESGDIWYQQDGTAVTELPKNLNYSIVLKKNEVPIFKSTITASKVKTVYTCEDTINIDDITVMYYDADGKGVEVKEGYTTNIDEIDMSIPGKKTLNVTYNGMTATVKLTVKTAIKGAYENINWSVDVEGKLTVTGTGDFCAPGIYSDRKAPWYDYRFDITAAEIDVADMTDASYMFYDCKYLTSVNFKNFNTEKVTNMGYMFSGCSSLMSLDLSGFDTSAVTIMSALFKDCKSLTNLDVGNFDVSNVTEMYSMFGGCSSLTSLDLSNFDTGNVYNMSAMFMDCRNLVNLNVNSFNINKVGVISLMFGDCRSLKSLDLSSFDFKNSKYIYMEGMIDRCYELQTIYTPYNLSQSVELPVWSSMDTWYRQDGTTVTELPQNVDYSIVIRRNEVPVVSALKAVKSKTSYTCGDTINFDDLTVTYYDADGTAHEIGSGDYATNADEIDMSTAGKKTLIITYLNGENVFTDEIELTVTAKESGDPQEIPVESITISRNKLSLKVGETAILAVKITPDNVTDSTVTWKSSNEKIAEVKNGVVRAVAVGKCTITASAGDQEAVCYVSIANNEITSKIILNTENTSITLPDTYDYGYDGKSKTPEVTVVCTVSGNSVSGNSISENSANGSAVTLEKDTDYTVTYENNVNAFEDRKDLETAQNAPRVVITGRNKYSGTLKKAFSIQKAAAPAGEEETVSILDCSAGREGRTVDLSGCFADYGNKTGYAAGTPAEDNTIVGSVLSGNLSLDEKGMLTYGTNAGEVGDFAVIPIVVSFTNYKDAVLNVKIIFEDRSVAVPVASPESGRQVVAGSKVTLTCDTAGAAIYYTTGSSEKELADPTEKSIRYTEPMTINKDMYIKAIAIKGDIRSKTVTLHYTVVDAADKVLKPYAVPGQGAVESGTKVELKSDTPDAAIYYVTGKNADMLGAVPVDDSHKYSGAVEIIGDVVIKAIAIKDGMEASDFATFVYKVKELLDPPKAEPASGSVDRGSYISLKTDNGVNIYYTMDQSNPTTSGSAKLYESMIRVDGDPGSTMVIKAAAEKNGVYSKVATLTYTVSANTVKGLRVMLAGSEEFTYTGSAITPAVIVTNNGEVLTEGEDYTVRYSNNVKAADKDTGKAPKITVIGKGNLTQSRSITFSILPKDIGDEEEVVGGNIVVVQGKTASPVLFYGGVKLTAKDFVNPDAKKKYSQDETITITGKGNFEGTRDIDVRVVNKEDLKKFTVAIDNSALKEEPLIYDGEAKTLDGYFEVFDTADRSTPLDEYSDYAVIYPKNNINAGKVKFTVVGLGEYYGTVTKTYTIKPKVVKSDADGNMEVNVNDGDSYPFRNGGVIITDLAVTCDGDILVPGKDYKVTYSNNKKICTGNKAKCTISFTGNYKGSKALVRKFNITPVVLDDVDQINGSVSVAVGDMVYTGKPGAYKSIPYVTVNGVLLKSADYTVSYYKDSGRTQVIDGKTASSSVNLTDSDKQQTVYVKIEGKGNYQGTLTAEYNVYKLAEDFIDLAKAKVSFVGGNKAEYTGEGARPEIEVMYKSGKDWKKVDANDIGTYVRVTYINNVNKGKATVMINGSGGKYVGSKTAVFSIMPKSMK